jgi:hypothetical protein
MDLLVALHVPGRAALVGRFLDELGIPHVNGLVEPSELEAIELDGASLGRAVDAASKDSDPRDVLVYLLALALRLPFKPILVDWLRENASAAEDGADEDDLIQVPDEAAALPEDVDEFTTLDKQLIYSIVDAAQGIEGALDADEIDDLVEEVVHLNGRRHRSLFHAGFRDVLFRRETGRSNPEDNPSRSRWYWAGVVQGSARAGRWHEIAGLLDAETVVAGLGDGEDGASHASTRFIVIGLFETGRHAEVPRFVRRKALVRWPDLFVTLLRRGTDVLRGDRAAEAKGIFDLLAGVVTELEASDGQLDVPIFREAKRRQAHCLRQVGEFVRAGETLEALLEDETSANVRAMLLADLGLIDGRLRRLADVRPPELAEEVDVFLEALSRGQERFLAAVALDVPYSAHGRLCLGVTALLEDEPERAVEHLESVRAAFLTRRDRYASGQLIETIELCLGIALCQALRTESMVAAAQMIERSLQAGLPFPKYLLPRTLDALELGPAEARATVGRLLLDLHGDEFLDDLHRSGMGGVVPELADALLARASLASRRSADRATDLRSALQLLIRHERYGTAACVLDQLEEMAVAGTGAEEFVDLLDDPCSCEPVWDREDALVARAHVLESLGRYEQAASLLTEVFHRTLSGSDEGPAEEADNILERIRSFGLPAEFSDPLKRRLSAVRETESVPELEEGCDLAPSRVLIVGGDEGQAKRDEALERELKRRAPNIRVTFLRTGWGGNWSPHLDAFRREVAQHDAVVIMRYIRTELGRQVRKACDVPWRSCWGAGREQAIRAILSAAIAGQAHRSANSSPA